MRFDREHRSGVVRAFLESGLTQAEFCRLKQGLVSERTLRAWLRLEEARDPSGKALAAIDAAMAQLEKVREGLKQSAASASIEVLLPDQLADWSF